MLAQQRPKKASISLQPLLHGTDADAADALAEAEADALFAPAEAELEAAPLPVVPDQRQVPVVPPPIANAAAAEDDLLLWAHDSPGSILDPERPIAKIVRTAPTPLNVMIASTSRDDQETSRLAEK